MDFLKEVENKLDLPDDEKSQVLKELQSHYCDLQDEYIASGMSEDEASVKAAQKMGDPADIARRTQSAHWGTTWKSAILAALPFVFFAILKADFPIKSNIWVLSSVIIAVIMLAVCVRELVQNRRPVWLATWLPASISYITTLLNFYIFQPDIYLSRNSNMSDEISKFIIITIVIDIFIWGLFALWLYKDSTKHQLHVTAILVLTVVVIITGQKYGWWIGHEESLVIKFGFLSVIITPILLLSAIRLFSQHPYGNVALASLFMYASFEFSQPIMHINFNITSSVIFQEIIKISVPIYTIWLYTRGHSWSSKFYTLMLSLVISKGLIFMPFMVYISSPDIRIYLVLTTCIQILFIILVLTPLILYKKSHNRKPVPVS